MSKMQIDKLPDTGAINQMKALYDGEVQQMQVPELSEFQKLGIQQENKFTMEQLLESIRSKSQYKNVVDTQAAIASYSSNTNLRLQFERWHDYMKAIQNAFDGNKYNMILKEQFIRTFGNQDQVKKLNADRQIKKNQKMFKRLEDFKTIGDIKVLKDIQNGYYYKQSANGYSLIGKKDLGYIEKSSGDYNIFKQLILENNKKSAILRSKKTDSQILTASLKKRAKNIYLQQNQLKKYRKKLRKNEITIEEYNAQGQNEYQNKEIARLQKQNQEYINDQLPQKVVEKLKTHRQQVIQTRASTRTFGETVLANKKKNQV